MISGSIQNRCNIPLQVHNVIVHLRGRCSGRDVGNLDGLAGCIQNEIQLRTVDVHIPEQIAVIEVSIGSGTVGPLDAHTVIVIGIAPGGAACGHGCQPTATLPGIGPGAIGEHIANCITGNRVAVVGGQQIAPFAVTVGIGCRVSWRANCSGGIGIFLPAYDVAGVIISPHPGPVLPEGVLPSGSLLLSSRRMVILHLGFS